jgi:hypothetical protein
MIKLHVPNGKVKPVSRLGPLYVCWRWKMYDNFSSQDRFKEMLHDAEKKRLARRTPRSRRTPAGLYRRGLDWLGRHLPGGGNR